MKKKKINVMVASDDIPPTMAEILNEIAVKRNTILSDILRNRAEILNAFVAKYGCQPDEIEIVEQTNNMGKEKVWFVRLKEEALQRRREGVFTFEKEAIATEQNIEGFIYEDKPHALLLRLGKLYIFTGKNVSSGIGIKTYKATLTIKEEVKP